MKRNELLFNLIADVVATSEDRYSQEQWGHFTTEEGQFAYLDGRQAAEYHPCNTTACIAGNAILLSTSQVDMVNAIREASVKCGEEFGYEDPLSKKVTLAGVMEHLTHKALDDACGIEDYAAYLLGIDDMSAQLLFSSRWYPRCMDVPTALRLIGAGANVEDVTYYREDVVRQAVELGTTAVHVLDPDDHGQIMTIHETNDDDGFDD